MGLKSIFQEGMKERQRRKSLRQVKNELQKKQEICNRQLTALGQKAWETKINITAFADLLSQLTAAQKQLDDLRTQAEKVQKQKQTTEEERKQENERFAASQKEVEGKKKVADENLQKQKNVLSAIQKEAEQATARLMAIAGERMQLEIKTAAATTPDSEKTAGQNKLAGLAKEEGELKIKVMKKEEAAKVDNAKITPLQEESDRLQKQIDTIKSEQKRVVGEWDKKISALNLEMTGSGNKIKETEKIQEENFRQLGENLAASGSDNKKISPELMAVKSTQTEMESFTQGIGSLEGQKDPATVSAYKKMMTLIIGGLVVLAAIVIALVLLLAPKKKEAPFAALLGEKETAVQNLGELAVQMQKGLGGIKDESEKIQGKKIVVASESQLKSILPSGAGWQIQNPSYGQGKFGELETAALQTDYTAADGNPIHVEVTDAGSASAMLAPVKMLFAMNVTVDNEEEYQKVSIYNDIPVLEKYDKQSHEASFGIIVKERYLVELKTTAENGLALLKEFMGKFDFGQLP